MSFKKYIPFIALFVLATSVFVACKKDAFSEKDAIAAQTALLQTKFDNEKSLEQLKQQGATALAQLNFQLSLQASSRTALQTDSINRAYKRYTDSLAVVSGRNSDSVALSNNKKVDINVFVQDAVTSQAIAGATVLLPTTIGTVLTGTTDATGAVTFPAAGNINVANTVQAIVSRTGYSSAVSNFITRSAIYGNYNIGSTTVQLWNSGNLRNTVTGTVTIESNLTNTSAENLSGQLITITNTYNGTRNFFTSVTNASGIYSINVPDAGGTVGGFSFLAATKDTTHTLWVNGLLPGIDTIPSIQTVPARFTLQQSVSAVTGTGPVPANTPLAAANGYAVQTDFRRFHAVVDTKDSLGRSFYFRNLTRTFVVRDPITQLDSYMFNATFGAVSPAQYDASGNTTILASGQAKYSNAVVAQTGVTNLPVRFVDLLSNSDNLFTRLPSLQTGTFWFNTGIAPNQLGYGGFVTQSLPISPSNASTTNYTLFLQRSIATGNLNGYDPNASALMSQNAPFNVLPTLNRCFVNSNPTGSGLPVISTPAGGTTQTINLTFGVGVLSQGVR